MRVMHTRPNANANASDNVKDGATKQKTKTNENEWEMFSLVRLERLRGVDIVGDVDGRLCVCVQCTYNTRHNQANNVDKSLRSRVVVKCRTKSPRKTMEKMNARKIELGLRTKWGENVN